jgi:hypothetical protein
MTEQENKFEKIYHTYEYAKSHGINPIRPETWDDNYKLRMQELAGIVPLLEEEIKKLKTILK